MDVGRGPRGDAPSALVPISGRCRFGSPLRWGAHNVAAAWRLVLRGEGLATRLGSGLNVGGGIYRQSGFYVDPAYTRAT